MNSDFIKLKEKNNNVVDINIHNESIRRKDRINNLKTLSNRRFNIIENSINELLETLLQKYN